MREEFMTKPDYTGRKTGIDRDNRAVEGNACERRQACSLADLRKRASPFSYPRERVIRFDDGDAADFLAQGAANDNVAAIVKRDPPIINGRAAADHQPPQDRRTP